MRRWRKALATGALALLSGGLIPAGLHAESDSGGDAAAGKRLAGQCRTCHGLDGVAQIPIAPHIGGEPAAYLMRQLRAFRDGAREHEMMTVIARALTDDAIDDLAAWYASLEPHATLAAGAPAPPDLCVACHGADGLSAHEDAPHLAGESVIYIETQLKAFRLGKREHEIMSAIAAEMSDAEMRAAAEYYAGIDFATSATE